MKTFNNKRVKLTIDHTKVSGDLTNYPLYIDLSLLNATFWANVHNGGGDIRIFTSANVECPREVVSCDTSTETGEVHVLLPTVSSSVDTYIYIDFGDASLSDYAPTDPYGRNAVWSSLVAKLEMHTAGNALDSSGNGNDGTVSGAVLAQDRFSRNNKAYQFDGVNDKIDAPIDYQGLPFTIAVWYKFNNNVNQTPGMFGFNDASGNRKEIYVQSTGSIRLFTFNGTTRLYYSTNAVASRLTGWHRLVGTYDGTTPKVYLDGVNIAVGTGSAYGAGPANNARLGKIGIDLDSANYWFDGFLSDARAIDRAWSPNEVSADFNNTSTPSTFYTVTDVPDVNFNGCNWLIGFTKRIKLTIDSSKVGGNLTNYPAYIDLSQLGDTFWSMVKNGGGDIRITTDDGITEVPREVVSCDTTTEIGEVHALIPYVSSTLSTYFYIYFGNADFVDYAVTDPLGRNAVWGTAGAELVLHTAGNALDSSGNGNDGVVTGATLTTDRFGRANKAYNFDGNDLITLTNTIGKEGALTLSGWFNVTNFDANRVIISAGDGGLSFSGPAVYIMSSTGVLRLNWRAGEDGSATSKNLGVTAITAGVWNHFVVTMSPGTPGVANLYINGVLNATASNLDINQTRSATPTWTIGRYWASATSFFLGSLSDIRMCNRILSPAEVLTLTNNQSAPSTFFSLEVEDIRNQTFITFNGFSLVGNLAQDTIAIEDLSNKALQRTVSDQIEVGELVDRQISVTRTAIDSISISEKVKKSLSNLFTDSLNISDSSRKALTNVVNDIINISEKTNKSLSVLVQDTLSVSEKVTKSISHFFTDTLSISDLSRKSLSRTVIDTLTISDKSFKRLSVIIQDLLSVSEIANRTLTIYRTVIDTISARERVRHYLNGVEQIWKKIARTVSTSWTKRTKPTTNWVKRIPPWKLN